MSKIARSYSDKHGLKDLIKEFIGVDISKQLQTSYFGGSLSDKQLKYCAQDVLYLHKIFAGLKDILEREKRLDLYERTIKFINTRVELDFASFKDDVWSH
jgi:ribonuclease D